MFQALKQEVAAKQKGWGVENCVFFTEVSNFIEPNPVQLFDPLPTYNLCARNVCREDVLITVPLLLETSTKLNNRLGTGHKDRAR